MLILRLILTILKIWSHWRTYGMHYCQAWDIFFFNFKLKTYASIKKDIMEIEKILKRKEEEKKRQEKTRQRIQTRNRIRRAREKRDIIRRARERRGKTRRRRR